jgi:hypothetical protein
MNWYEDAVGDLLEHASLGADLVAKIVKEIQGDAAPDPLLLARIKRERSAAMQKLERDRVTTRGRRRCGGWIRRRRRPSA